MTKLCVRCTDLSFTHTVQKICMDEAHCSDSNFKYPRTSAHSSRSVVRGKYKKEICLVILHTPWLGRLS